MTVQGFIKWDEGPWSLATDGTDTGAIHYWLESDNPADDRNTAIEWLRNNAPSEFYGLLRDKITLEVRVSDNFNGEPGANFQQWGATVTYRSSETKDKRPLKVGEVRMSVRSSTGQTQTMLYSRRLIQESSTSDPIFKFSGKPDDIERLLNIEVDNSEETGTMFTAKGISVPLGAVEIVIETKIADVDVKADYLVNAAKYAGQQRVNEIDYRGFPSGSLKLTNFDASQDTGDEAATDLNDKPWDLNYTFQYSSPLSADDLNNNLPPGIPKDDGAATPTPAFTAGKKGWDYYDVLYVDKEVEVQDNPVSVKFLFPIAVRAAIHEIYELLDFAAELKI